MAEAAAAQHETGHPARADLAKLDDVIHDAMTMALLMELAVKGLRNEDERQALLFVANQLTDSVSEAKTAFARLR